MAAHLVMVYLSVGLAISIGVNAALIVMYRRRGDIMRRTASVFRKYREFHVRRIRRVHTAKSTLLVELADAQKRNRQLEETLKFCWQERSFFLSQWKIFAPKAEELRVLCEHWEAETHYWRKKCWWRSDRRTFRTPNAKESRYPSVVGKEDGMIGRYAARRTARLQSPLTSMTCRQSARTEVTSENIHKSRTCN